MRKLIAPAIAASLMMLVGCGQTTEEATTEDRLDQAAEEIDQATDKAGAEIEQAGENAADAVDDATDGNPNTNP